MVLPSPQITIGLLLIVLESSSPLILKLIYLKVKSKTQELNIWQNDYINLIKE